jgi:hypothetical protein
VAASPHGSGPSRTLRARRRGSHRSTRAARCRSGWALVTTRRASWCLAAGRAAARRPTWGLTQCHASAWWRCSPAAAARAAAAATQGLALAAAAAHLNSSSRWWMGAATAAEQQLERQPCRVLPSSCLCCRVACQRLHRLLQWVAPQQQLQQQVMLVVHHWRQLGTRRRQAHQHRQPPRRHCRRCQSRCCSQTCRQQQLVARCRRRRPTWQRTFAQAGVPTRLWPTLARSCATFCQARLRPPRLPRQARPRRPRTHRPLSRRHRPPQCLAPTPGACSRSSRAWQRPGVQAEGLPAPGGQLTHRGLSRRHGAAAGRTLLARRRHHGGAAWQHHSRHRHPSGAQEHLLGVAQGWRHPRLPGRLRW